MNDDTLLWLIVLPLVGLMVLILGIGAALMIRDTIRRRGKWGLSFRPVNCPECGEPAPIVRMPANRRQALWGGHTCEECGTEYDKWGRPVDDD
jgi:hypothetical protein